LWAEAWALYAETLSFIVRDAATSSLVAGTAAPRRGPVRRGRLSERETTMVLERAHKIQLTRDNTNDERERKMNPA
jgi:predicted protein tyrosine phosphatase